MALTNLSNKKGNTILKPLHGDTFSNDSCSSTTYDYKSESDRQSLSRLVEQGSQINRYYDKYISLMESKLLIKCIRTRALYDALRSQLLSSSISVSSEADLKQRQSPTGKTKALEEDNKSNDMLASVNLVDKGGVLGSGKLNECCSCCNCNSKAGLHENVQKGRRNREGHAGGYITSKSSVISKQGAREELRLGKKFKAKNIKSDPCACAFKLKELIRLQSRVFFKKIRPEQPINERDRLLKTVDKHKLMRFNNEKVRKSYHKVKRSKVHPTQYTENMGEGGIKTIVKLNQIQDSSDVEKKKSIEQLKLAQQKIIDSFNDDRKAIEKSKPEDGSPVTNITIRLKDRVSDNRQLHNWELKQRIPRKPGNLLKSISTSSIEKSFPFDDKANRNKLKQTPSVSRDNKINLLDAPLFYAPRKLRLSIKPRSHEGANKQKHMMQKIRAGSHVLKRCLCSLTIKVKKNKSKITKNGTREMPKIKVNVSKCDCSDYITNTEKQDTPKKQSNKYKPGRTNTYPDTKSVSNHTFKCECPLTKATTKEKESLSKCECVDIITNSSKEKGGPNYKPSQINTHFRLKFTSTRASGKTKEKRRVQNDSVQTVNNITTKDKLGIKTYPGITDSQRETKSILNHISKCECPFPTKEKENVSECECLNIITNSSKDKGGSKYKSSQIIIHSGLKSTSTHAFDKTKEKRRVQNHSVQTVNNITTKEKLGIKTNPAITDNQRESKSISNHASKYKCPFTNVTTKEKEELSSKQQENNKTQTGFKPRFHRSKHIKNKQSQISSSTGKSKYTTRKHGLSRCLCTLKLSKLEKKNKNSRKLSKHTGSPSVSTTKVPQTQHNVKNVSISTESRERRQIQENHLILPFDCGFCDPGVFNPRECKVVLTKRQSICISVTGKKKNTKYDTYKFLEKMKKRDVGHSKDFGIVTQRTKMVSKSSDIPELRRASNPLFVKSDFKQRNSSLEKFRNMRNYPELSHLPKNAREMYSEKSLEQGIRIGSNFSFNIEFYKDSTPETNIISRSKNNSARFFKNKQYVEQLTNRSNNSQTFRLKTTRVSPMLNKCFCTLQLLKKEEQRPSCKLITPFVIKKPTQVYALSTVAKTKINSPEILLLNEDNLGPHCVGSYYPISYTNKALSNTKQWKYFKNNSLSSFISISTIAFKSKKNQSYIHESKCTLLQISRTNQSLLDFTSKETVRFESKFSYEINYLKNIQPNIQRNVKSAHSKIYLYAQRQSKKQNLEIQEKIRDPKIIENITNPSQLTGIQPLLRRCYCTMNTQLHKSSKKRHHNPTKLKDYECEPGVCIPYECDPYECQKMIMKRLAKKVSRMSGTEKRLRKSSSMASSISSRTRKYLTNLTREHKHHKTRPSGIKYQTLPQTFGKQRQAFRIGSSFNFDIEFSKGSAKSAPAGYIKRSSTTRSSKTYYRHRKDRGTRGFRGGRRDRDSQSMTQQMRHRASSVTPMLKRCFCTLKLQKKGRQHKERQLQTLHQGTSTNKNKKTKPTYEYPVDASSELITKGKGMQTKEYIQSKNIRARPRERSSVLEPYECEPGVCVPGLCDPYECEKLIKKRRAKEKMTGTTGPKTKSTSSSFTSSNTSKTSSMGQSTLNRPHEKVRRRDQSLREMVTRDKPRPAVLPPRQAFKIGSNFSFDMEFYKDKGLNNNYEQGQTSATTIKKSRPTRDQAHRARDQAHRARDQAHRANDQVHKASDQAHRARDQPHGARYQAHRTRYGTKMSNRGVSGRCSSLCSTICQNCPKKKDKALGPILKRCFCTLKLHKRKQGIKYIEKEKPLQMCDTGCITEFDITEVPTLQTKSMMTVNKYKALPYKLEPYECEPGVCVPGECDPYECEKLIKKRLMNRSSGTLTDRYRTTSTSNTLRHRRRHRDGGAQPAMQYRKLMRTRDIRRKLRSTEVQEPIKPGVKLGSNFSFNLEFYKDSSPGSSVASSRSIEKNDAYKKPRRTFSKSTERRSISPRNKKGQYRKNMRNKDSQVFPRNMQPTMAGVGPFLKRCFCTLQLQKPAINKKEIKSVKKSTQCERVIDNKEGIKPVAREIGTLTKKYTHALEPYECEPGVCIPGQCDPYECEKRIKLRNMKNFGTRTTGASMKSMSNMTSKAKRTKGMRTSLLKDRGDKMRKTSTETIYRVKKPPPSSQAVENINRKAVRLGSNFSFNVEFSKDKSSDRGGSNYDKTRNNYRPRAKYKSRASFSTAKRKNRGSHGRDRLVRHINSQVGAQTESKGSGMAPILKRCFCTLTLQRAEVKNTLNTLPNCLCIVKKNTINHSYKEQNISQHTSKSTYKVKNKLKNCICEPTTQDKNVSTKNKHFGPQLELDKCGPGVCVPGVCVPGVCVPGQCEKRIKPRNKKNFGKKPPPPSQAVENINRQAASVGSNFSFNVEFFKDKSSNQGGSNYDETRNNTRPRAKYKTGASFSTAKRKNRGSLGRDRLLHHRNSQVGAQTESRGSGMAPILKRCCCTLTLQRAEVKNTLNTIPACLCNVKKITKEQNTSQHTLKNIKKVKNKLKNCICECTTQDKKVSTEKKYFGHQFEPDECEPGICTPGNCNPYECLERIKKRGIRRVSRTIGTPMKPPSEVNKNSSMAPPRKKMFASKKTKFKEGYSPQNVERIVEEPRFPFLTGSSQKQGVRISSKFSFDIEFFREDLVSEEIIPKKVSVCVQSVQFMKTVCSKLKSCILQPSTKKKGLPSEKPQIKKGMPSEKPQKKNGLPSKKSQKKKGLPSKKSPKIKGLPSEKSQTEHIETDDKSSAVGILKRCFCTMKLHKSNLSNHPQAHTCICRMEEIRPITGLGLFGPKEYWVQYQKQQPVETKKSFQMESSTANNRKKDSYDLEIIMSYTPNKFSKNYSTHFGKTCRSTSHCKFCRKQGPVDPINITKGKKFTKTTRQMPEVMEDNPSTLKKMLCRCKYLFTKRIKQLQSNKNIEKEDFKRRAIKQPRTEVLKTSKSERHPNNAANAGIKTSKSLKVARASGKDDNTKKYSRFQSGDAEQGYNFTNKPQNTGIHFVKKNCLHCQAQFKPAISINKQVHFVLYHKDEALKPKNVRVTEPKKESKSVTFLFKNSKFKKEDVKCFKLCSCCESFKRKINISWYGHGLDSKKKILKHGQDTAKLIHKEITVLPKENKKKDKQSYPCCVCRKNMNDAKVTNKVKKRQPCRSMACKEKAKKLATNSGLEVRRTKKRKCVCGTKIYAAEPVKEALSEESEFKRARGKKKTEIELEQEAKIRGKNYIEEDEGVIKRRKINDKYLNMMKMKKLKKYKDIPDVTLVKPVFNSNCTYRNLKLYLRYPMRILKKFQNAANDGFGVALLKRLKLRCLAMTYVKKDQETLEEHPVTNFLIYSIDRDLKRRIHPKKPSLWRHPDTSFGCSPLMLSLRKRPWLSVYHKCSWFYPPCLRLLQVWRQFMDILLFLLAVAVLSPFIVSMEFYRAMMCCFLCTG